MYNLSYLWIIWKSILPFWVTFNSTSLRYQRTMLNFLLFGFFDQFLPPTHTLIKEIVCEYLCYGVPFLTPGNIPNLGSNPRLLWLAKEEHQIYHSIWLNNSFNFFLTRSYLCWWERTELQVDFECHFNTLRKLISINYLWTFISWCWI